MKLKYWVANLFGYELVRKKSDSFIHKSIESHLKAVLDQQAINCVLDVGANVGQYGKKLRDEGYANMIASFEPLPSAFEELKNISKTDTQWETFNYALGRDEGTHTITARQSSALTSFLPAAERAKGLFHRGMDVLETIDVEVKRLDSILDQIIMFLDEPRIFLKMDTQGYDLEVFAGVGEKFLKYIFGLQSELSVIPLYEGMPDYIEALSVYRKDGFVITGLYPVFRLGQFQKENPYIIGEIDLVMIRDDHHT